MVRRSSSSDLFECIEAHSSFSEGVARGLFKQVVNVVYDLRQMGICHRDIKDENLVVDSNGIVSLAAQRIACILELTQHRTAGQTHRLWFCYPL